MSITLTNAITVTAAGSTVETAANAANTSIHVDFLGQMLTITFEDGNTSGQTFTPGNLLKNLVALQINMVTGVWFTNTGQSGTFNAASIASIQSIFYTLRNQAESFGTSASIIPGATVAWTT